MVVFLKAFATRHENFMHIGIRNWLVWVHLVHANMHAVFLRNNKRAWSCNHAVSFRFIANKVLFLQQRCLWRLRQLSVRATTFEKCLIQFSKKASATSSNKQQSQTAKHTQLAIFDKSLQSNVSEWLICQLFGVVFVWCCTHKICQKNGQKADERETEKKTDKSKSEFRLFASARK